MKDIDQRFGKFWQDLANSKRISLVVFIENRLKGILRPEGSREASGHDLKQQWQSFGPRSSQGHVRNGKIQTRGGVI